MTVGLATFDIHRFMQELVGCGLLNLWWIWRGSALACDVGLVVYDRVRAFVEMKEEGTGSSRHCVPTAVVRIVAKLFLFFNILFGFSIQPI